MSRHVLITGGTGLIGQRLCRVLMDRGDCVTVYSRRPAAQVQSLCGPVGVLTSLEEAGALQGVDAVINLAGEGIANRRWSERRKQQLWDSRITLTDTLVKALSHRPRPPECLISGSAVGYYGDQGDRTVTEETRPNDEFAHRLCQAWEASALQAESAGIRVCLCRTGLVLGPGGFLQRLYLPFKLGLGGRLGKGDQFMPWIHREDEVRAILFLMDDSKTRGAYNLVSPNPVSNREMTRAIGRTLGRPTPFPVPASLLRLGLGELSRLLLTGQRALPARLEAAGFRFLYADLEQALTDAFSDLRAA